MKVAYEFRLGRVYGIMPDGKWKYFDTLSEYEDAYYDAVYAISNSFMTDDPEDF